MLEPPRTLRLSLALNVVLLVGAWVGLWYLTGSPLSSTLKICKPSFSLFSGDELEVEEVLEDELEPSHVFPPSVPSSSTPTCDICASDVGKALCDAYGPEVVKRTMAFNQGNTRLQRVLAKWRSGKPVRYGVIGGSNSAGQGVWWDNQMTYSQHNMHTILFNWLDKKFPQAGDKVMEKTGGPDQNSLVNGALPGKGTDYYAMCTGAHLPDDIDLIVVEFSVNDQFSTESTETYEYMIRYLLERPNSPAVLELQTFGYEFEKVISGGATHLATDLYYNIPVIAPRTLFYSVAEHNVTKFWDWFYWYNPHEVPKDLHGVDLRHFGEGGHRMCAQLMEAYLEQQLCEMDRIEATAGTSDIDALYPEQPVQRLSLLSTFHRDHPEAGMAKIQPTCRTVDSELLPLAPTTAEGWEPWTWRDEETGKEKRYLRATKPGAKVTFKLGYINNRVELFYLRSKSFGLGNVKCWLNGKHEATIEGWWDNERNIGQVTRWKRLVPGEYTLECVLQKSSRDPGKGTEFRIMAVMSM